MTSSFDLKEPAAAGGHGPSGDTARAQHVLDEAKADLGLRLALDHAEAVGGSAGLRLLNRYRGRIAASQARITSEHVPSDGDTRRAERLLNDGKTSGAQRRRTANRAKAVGHNNDLAAKLDTGDLSEEQLDVIATASDKTDGEAANDTDLIDKVAAVPPEQGKKIVDEYLAKRATADGVQTEHDRHRKLRRASKFHNKNKGLDSISLEGDGPAIKAMWAKIERRANDIYKRDGGRDLPHCDHPRSWDQRKFDAAVELICGVTTTPAGRATPDRATPPINTGTDTGSDTAAGSKRHTPRNRPSSTRPQIVIGLTIDKLIGKDPAAVAIQHGLGLIPDSVLANYAADADIIAALFDRNGEPLWLGRLRRYANTTQMIALILRDKSCVLCGADHTRCQAHHTMPWNAPGKGRTDLDDLVLLCETCHQRLHGEQHTIYQDHHGAWRTRPAAPNEIPPPRPAADRTEGRNTIQRE